VVYVAERTERNKKNYVIFAVAWQGKCAKKTNLPDLRHLLA